MFHQVVPDADPEQSDSTNKICQSVFTQPGSKADIAGCVEDVRFAPESGHQLSNASSIASALAYNPAAYHPLNQLVLKQRLGGRSIHSDLTYTKISDRRFSRDYGIGY